MLCITPHAAPDAPFHDDEPQILTVPAQVRADRLDKILAGLLPEHSRSRLQGWIASGHVWVNGAPAKTRQSVGPGDALAVWAQQAPEDSAFAPEPVDFEIVADSPEWIVVNKPAGLVTHPGAGNWRGTLLNGLLFRYPELAGVARAGIVHRLDKDTSGLLVVARTERAQTHLVRQLQARSMGREYLALAHGWADGAGTVATAVGRDPKVPVRMSVERPIAPKPAITHYATLRHGEYGEDGGRGERSRPRVSEIACRLETGRTHQIRVHLSSIGHPLLGDALYGGRPLAGAARQMLHARALCFLDPVNDEARAFAVDTPVDMRAVMESIAWMA